MVFSSAVFLFGFLPVLLFLYFVSPQKLKNGVLLVFSLLFYYVGGVGAIAVLLAVVGMDYVFALAIVRGRHPKWWLILAVTGNIGLLFYYKYFNFFLENANRLFGMNLAAGNIVLPIGISFFTFQALSYVIDVYHGRVSVQKNPFRLLLYVSLFPQLVAGPIVRYQTVEQELSLRAVSLDDVTAGVERFVRGLGKKMLIANQMGMLADIVYALDEPDTPVAFLGAAAYMFQIFYDFSGYSDMAIGLGRMFGFHFLENFDYPYISASVTEFWRRWHMSLSAWFRDYVYIPLGGNRKGAARQVFNLLIVWLLTGLWHGASWNFVLWGLYYFVFLVLEKFLLKGVLKRCPKPLSHAVTLVIVLAGWVLFRAETLPACGEMLQALFGFRFSVLGWREAVIYLQTYGVYFVPAILFCMPVYPKLCKAAESIKNERRRGFFEVCRYGFLLGVFVVSIIFLAHSSYNPFIYFRF
ncbi:MAG: MBOAT family protein [Clostridia bacterium]|nr:MBOAT family protein [Clostridia bacterium]